MGDDLETNPETEVDIHFKPVIELKPVEVKTLEDDEEELFKMRARLFRFDNLADPPEWKERGAGDIRMLRHKKSSKIRLLMRREQVLKICCNHFLTKSMKLKAHNASEKAFVWTTLADFADEEPRQEVLAIRFGNPEKALQFKSKFEELQAALPDLDKEKKDEDEAGKEKSGTEEVTSQLSSLAVSERDSTAKS